MNKKMLSIILGAALIGSFFLAYFGKGSGLDFVTAKGADWKSYTALLFPISGVMLLLGGVNNGNYPGGRGIWTWLPLLTVLCWLFVFPLIDGVAIKYIFKGLGKGWGIGLWITIASSLVLAFYNPRD
jgi:hypothetical protein